jgi:NADH dehydrogenase
VLVTEVDGTGVTFRKQDGTVERLASKTILWAGGVHVGGFGGVLAERTGVTTDRGGRLPVNPDLTIPGYPEIYVVGDLAGLAGKDGKQLPGVAQVAMQGGAYAARAIVARLNGPREIKPFHYFDKGDLAVIGRAAAVARIFGFRLHGLIAWLVWLFVHIMYLVQFQNRVLVFIRWGFLFLTFSRGARLITGRAATDTEIQ